MPQGHWLRTLEAGRVVLIDGGTGSELKRRGVVLERAAWSGRAAHDHPQLLQAIHEDYIRAGAEVIITNTFGTARSNLAAAGLADHAEAIVRQAVAAALAARAAHTAVGQNKHVDVAGSLSNLPPNMNPGHYPPEVVETQELVRQAELLADAGVDLIATEMLQHPDHGARAMAAAVHTGLPVWLGVSCRRKDGELVAFNDARQPLAEVLKALLPMGPAVVNIMHTELTAIDQTLELVKSLWDGPIGVYPEVPYSSAPRWHSNLAPAALAELASGWVDSGARLIGGCCGTGPEHIEAMASMLAARRAS